MAGEVSLTNAPQKASATGGSAAAGYGVFVDWFERLALLLVWGVTIAIFGALRPDTFLTWSNFSTILGSQSVIVVIALGLIIPLTAGDYDLSIASGLTLAATVLAVVNVNHGGPIALPVLPALAVGVLVGPGNPFFVPCFRINSLILSIGVGPFAPGG